MNQYGGSEGSSDETTQNSNGLKKKHKMFLHISEMGMGGGVRENRGSDNPKMFSEIIASIKILS